MHDPEGLAGLLVQIPDRAWPEFSEAPAAQCTKCTILGPTARATSTYAVDALGIAYLFDATDLVRFLPLSSPARKRRKRRLAPDRA